MSWSIPFLDSKGELFSSLSESNRLPKEPDDSDPDCWRSYNMKEGEFVQANTLLLFPNTQDTIMDYHGDANEILLKSTNQMLNRAQNPVT
jgi:hypothetical protein